MSDTPVFSWSREEYHLYSVTKNGDTGEWRCSGTIARFKGPEALGLLRVSIDHLKYSGWRWVEPQR